jgi:beta-lactamase class A
MTVADLAVLTAAVSDNVATNLLLDRVGLDAVGAALKGAGIDDVVVHDVVRDRRDASLPPAFATGTARGLCRMMATVARGGWLSKPARDLLLGWMGLNLHRDWVPDVLGPMPSGDVVVVNKTGIDGGVLADTGLIRGDRVLAYAVVVRWSSDDDAAMARRAALELRARGAELVALANSGS